MEKRGWLKLQEENVRKKHQGTHQGGLGSGWSNKNLDLCSALDITGLWALDMRPGYENLAQVMLYVSWLKFRIKNPNTPCLPTYTHVFYLGQ